MTRTLVHRRVERYGTCECSVECYTARLSSLPLEGHARPVLATNLERVGTHGPLRRTVFLCCVCGLKQKKTSRRKTASSAVFFAPTGALCPIASGRGFGYSQKVKGNLRKQRSTVVYTGVPQGLISRWLQIGFNEVGDLGHFLPQKEVLDAAKKNMFQQQTSLRTPLVAWSQDRDNPHAWFFSREAQTTGVTSGILFL